MEEDTTNFTTRAMVRLVVPGTYGRAESGVLLFIHSLFMVRRGPEGEREKGGPAGLYEVLHAVLLSVRYFPCSLNTSNI